MLIPLTNSPSVEVQGNSAAALGNLSSKGTTHCARWCADIQLQKIMLHSMPCGTNLMAVCTHILSAS